MRFRELPEIRTFPYKYFPILAFFKLICSILHQPIDNTVSLVAKCKQINQKFTRKISQEV